MKPARGDNCAAAAAGTLVRDRLAARDSRAGTVAEVGTRAVLDILVATDLGIVFESHPNLDSLPARLRST